MPGIARSSQTRTAVLGALSVMPMTGYALREAIREVLGHFWSESFGQIYPALAELERDGYVERRESARNGSSTFRITPSGTAQLRELLSEPIQRDPPRNGLLLRLFFGRHLGPAACRALVLDARAEAERRLAEYVAIRTDIAQAPETAGERPYQLLTLAFGEHTARAAIAWANEAVAALDQLDSTKPSSTHLNKENRT
jgi:DNA-binding PadR family transcriptional regulator